ncbi:GAF domain-containing protein, partial [bacterium]|nr:GAF domain-containing protein [bacterium]
MSKSTSESRLLEIQNELNLLLQQDQEALEPVDLIARSCPIISRFFNAERTTFFVYDEKEGRLQSIYAEGPTPLKIILSLGEGLVGACFSSLKSSYTNTPYSKQDFQKKYDRRTGFKTHSSLVTPLYMGERPFGVLQVLNREDGFNGDNLKEVESVAKTLTSHLNFYQFIRGGAAARSELESLLQTIPEVLYRLDQDGNFGFLSQEVLKWGYFREELMGQHFSIILHPEDAPRVSRESVLPLYAGKITGQQGAPGLFDERRSGKRGSKRLRIRILPGPHINYEELFPGVREEEDKAFFVEVNASGFWEKDPSGQAYFAGTMGIITDVTERHFAEQRLKATQQELIQAERFAGLGTLSAGIAHDFNNILAAIGLSADVSRALLKEGQVGDQLDDTIKTIAEYVKKAADLTSRLLALGRSNISKVESSNISDIIQDATGVILNQLENKG